MLEYAVKTNNFRIHLPPEGLRPPVRVKAQRLAGVPALRRPNDRAAFRHVAEGEVEVRRQAGAAAQGEIRRRRSGLND